MDAGTTNHSGVQESEDFWDRFTASAEMHPANLYRYSLISNMIAALPGHERAIVDLGCGNGFLLKHVHERGLGRRLMGFDGSAAIVQRNRVRQAFAQFDQADLQFADKFPQIEPVDVVICSEVIEHMPSYAPVFRIAMGCLKPGGHFILTTQGGKRRRHDVALLGHLRHYAIDALADEVASAGFSVVRTQKAGWPALTLQKVAASMFLGRVSQELASTAEPSALFRLACRLVGIGLLLSSKSHGPQLVILARKPGGTVI